MNTKIGFSSLRKEMSSVIRQWQDSRDSTKKEIDLHDIVMSGFACMFYQQPSLLQFQQELEDSIKNNNLRTQFDVSKIPSSTQMKEVLNNVPSKNFERIFNVFHKKMEKIAIVESFKNKLGTYFASTDGTQYFSSTKVRCKKCLRKECKDGIHYSHQMLQCAIVHPSKKIVLPLMAVEICNAPDINPKKQDCEWKGFFRFLSVLKRSALKLPLTILLDALFADQPVVEAIQADKHHFIIVSKPDDNKYLHEEFSLVTTRKEALEVEDDKYLHIYKWSNHLPLNSKRQVFVNFVEKEADLGANSRSP